MISLGLAPMLRDKPYWPAHASVLSQPKQWMESHTQSSILWVHSPNGTRNSSVSHAMALLCLHDSSGMDSTIYRFYIQPSQRRIPKGHTVEEIGTLELLYSLIVQLLQVDENGDTFEISEEVLRQLDYTMESYSSAMSLLKALLRSTKRLKQCIIDGINHICLGKGVKLCNELLATLSEHQRESAPDLKILLTTTGNFEGLLEHTELRDPVMTAQMDWW